MLAKQGSVLRQQRSISFANPCAHDEVFAWLRKGRIETTEGHEFTRMNLPIPTPTLARLNPHLFGLRNGECGARNGVRREAELHEEIFDECRRRGWIALHGSMAERTCRTLGEPDFMILADGGDGNLFVMDEHAERLWLPQRHAPAIKTMLARHRIANGKWAMANGQPETRPLEVADLKRFVAGADVFSRQSDGTTIAAQYAKLGITLRCANTDRVNGWAEIMTRFGDVDAKIVPTLFIHKRCGRLIETLPALQHDPNRPEDVLKVDADEDGVGGDDAADALRYLVATKSRAVIQRKLRGL